MNRSDIIKNIKERLSGAEKNLYYDENVGVIFSNSYFDDKHYIAEVLDHDLGEFFANAPSDISFLLVMITILSSFLSRFASDERVYYGSYCEYCGSLVGYPHKEICLWQQAKDFLNDIDG